MAYGVLILHGFSSSLDCVKGIEASIRTLGLPTRMPVLRGHGAETPEALRGVKWKDWVFDAETALKDLMAYVEKAIVIGHSMGGLVTLTLAAEYRDWIDSIVLAAAAVKLFSPFAPGGRLHFLAPLVQVFVKNWNTPPVFVDPALAKYCTNYPWVPTDAIGSLFDFIKVTRQRLPEVNVPMFLLQSYKDTSVPPDSVDLLRKSVRTPPNEIELAWFHESEHEMFLDLEREAAIGAIEAYVKKRISTT